MSSFKNRFSNLPAIIETADRYIINGQPYKKTTMEAEHLNFAPASCTSEHNLPCLLRRSYSVRDTSTNYDWHNRSARGDMYIVDNIDPTITYVIVDSGDIVDTMTTSRTSIYKYQTVNEITSLKWKGSPTTLMNNYAAGCSITAHEILGQDDNYVYVTFMYSLNSSYYNYYRYNKTMIKAFDKVNGNCINLFEKDMDRDLGNYVTSYGIIFSKIYETQDNIYIALVNSSTGITNTGNTSNLGMMGIYRIDKQLHTLVSLGTIAADAIKTLSTEHVSKGFMKNGFIHFYSFTNMTEPQIRLTRINPQDNTFTNSIVNVTLNQKVTRIPCFSAYDAAAIGRGSYYLMLKEHNGRIYLHIYGLCTQYRLTSNLAEDYRAITTFLVDDSTQDLIAQDQITPFKGALMQGLVECIDEDLLVVTNRDCVKVLQFNVTAGKYDEIQIIDISNHGIGCDTQNNIWIMDTAWRLHKHSIDLPTKVDIQFEHSDYDYMGTPIKSKLLIQAVNYLNRKVNIKLELTLRGPALFDNDTKVIEVTTSSTGILEVPITISGSGSISVYPKLKF